MTSAAHIKLEEYIETFLIAYFVSRDTGGVKQSLAPRRAVFVLTIIINVNKSAELRDLSSRQITD